MGLENIDTAENLYQLYKRDKGYCSFIIGLLTGMFDDSFKFKE